MSGGATDWLAEEAATIALCWRIERVDGVAIGLTAHDRDLVVDGFRYRAAPGMVPAAVERQAGLEVDTTEMTGALSAAAFTERDLVAGRWDGARIACLAADWSGRGAPVPLGEGTIGAVELGEGGFTAELAGPGVMLDRPVHEETAPECRATLGDRRCRVPMAGRRRFARVAAADGEVVTLDRAEPVADAYAGGRLRWFGGANAGMEGAVAASAGAAVTLATPPAFVPAAGDLVELVEGCDKSLATCHARFANAANFRGEPHLPGIDLVTRWPGG